MKRLFWMTAATAASLSLTACEREPVGVERVQPAARGQLATVEGVITDLEADEIEIDTRVGEMEFELDEGVGVYESGILRDVGLLREGTEVRATYSVVGDEKNLIHLEVSPFGVE